MCQMDLGRPLPLLLLLLLLLPGNQLSCLPTLQAAAGSSRRPPSNCLPAYRVLT
jgi:hypothetical protein